ncbi:hypothetical protein [Cellulomonas xylanilytica]|uniref:DUF3592 domain-containing protein n=1 Tax=Cellulomonas xylanilytica TaxID=233583 RepID=A0A510V4F3_9CELL|nr:hypothetical protein [Cellulomonas xylanilytica]GEK21753.1 hypothetical protein CXY01_22730 [Cellulomonas xylanilytica]
MSGPHVVLTVAVVVLVLGVVALPVGIRLLTRARAVPRIRLPARAVSKVSVLAGDVITVEYPGPDGAPLRREVFAAFRQGLGATPMFHGYVYVNPADPTDVKTRPQGKVGPGWTVTIVGIVLLVVGILLLLVALVGLWAQSIPVVG